MKKKIAGGVGLALCVLWCASAAAADKTVPSTIVWMEEKCVVSKAGVSGLPRHEIAPLVAALVSALAPALIDKSVDAVAASLQARANDKERKAKGMYGDSFYQLAEGQVLSPGQRIGCLSLAHGVFPRPATAGEPAFTGHLGTLSVDDKFALVGRGITAQPDLYVETSIEFSMDGTAFRLLPQAVIYTRSLRGAKNGNFQGLALIAAFRRPLAKQEGDYFAVGSIALPALRPGNDYLAGDLGANQVWQPRSNWMPLPAVDAELEGTLAAYAQNSDAREESRRKVAALLEENASDAVAFRRHTALLDADKTALCPFTGPKAGVHADGYRSWRTDVLNRIDAQQRNKAKLSRAAGATPKPADAARLGDLETVINILTECLAAETAGDAAEAAKSRLQKVVPFDVELTAVETFEPSKFLGFAANALTGAKDSLAAGLTPLIDPTRREEAAQAEQKARLDAQYAARELWTAAKKAELDLAAAKDDLAREKAALDLDLAKRKANRAYAALDWAVPFPETGQ